MPKTKHVDESFFKRWSREMAYVLGFFAADGNLTVGSRNNHYIEFTSTDKELITRVRRFMGSRHKITRRIREENWKPSFRIQIGSKMIFNDLINLGFSPAKSKTLNYPDVPKRYFKDFLRGYFDGDGHVITAVYKRKNRNGSVRILFSGFTCGSKRFLEKLKDELWSYNIVDGGTFYYSKGYRLNFSNTDSIKLYNFLYKGTPYELYLSRKKKVFEKYINAVVA